MNIHIMFDEKFIDTFISNYSQTHENIDSKYYVIRENISDRIIYVKNKSVIPIKLNVKTLKKILNANEKTENIFLHGFSLKIVPFFKFIPASINILWIFYGTEIFQTPLTLKLLDEKSERIYPEIYKRKSFLKYFPLHSIKPLLIAREIIKIVKIKKIVSHIDYFCHWNYLDYEYIQSIYPEFRANFLYFGYYFANNKKNHSTVIKNKKIDFPIVKEKYILIGNQSSISLNHISILDYLVQFNQEPIKIVCPLSYGDKEYRVILMEYGKSKFNDNFIPLVDFLPLEKYIKIFDKIDVVVMNNIRTQGAGNISIALKAGKKVYLNPKNTHYKMLKNMGAIVFSTDDFFQSSYKEIFNPLTLIQKKKNEELIDTEFDDMFKNYNSLP